MILNFYVKIIEKLMNKVKKIIVYKKMCFFGLKMINKKNVYN